MGPSTSSRCDPSAGYILRFRSLHDAGSGLSFPCDEHGRVDMDRLSAAALNNYLYARGVVGKEFCTPSVEAVFPAHR